MIAFCLAQIYSFPPYTLTAAGVGYMSIGPLIGAVLGSVSIGLISDPIIKWASRRNNGVFEPEYRLLPIFPVLLVGPALIGFGYVAQNGLSVYRGQISSDISTDLSCPQYTDLEGLRLQLSIQATIKKQDA